jgi:ArsR family transcriptional regulator, arsenate/arsenite/antimonite-responsive transcriptional repressor
MQLEPHQLTTCLSDITRLRIVTLIQQQGELCVCEIVSSLEIPQPKASKHLAILRGSGIIRSRRQGQWIHYRIDPEIPAWANHVIEHLISACISRSPYCDDSDRFTGNSLSNRCA